MDAVVVYESMWGNTAAIARAIAAGLGGDAVALTTDAATPEVIEGCRLVVAGAPVHAVNLPTDATRASASEKVQGGGAGLHADVNHPSLRDWLEGLSPGERCGAAFETRIRGPLGHGAARAIADRFRELGYDAIDEPHSFTVKLSTRSHEPAALVIPGQEDKAYQWGQHLAAVLSRSTHAS